MGSQSMSAPIKLLKARKIAHTGQQRSLQALLGIFGLVLCWWRSVCLWLKLKKMLLLTCSVWDNVPHLRSGTSLSSGQQQYYRAVVETDVTSISVCKERWCFIFDTNTSTWKLLDLLFALQPTWHGLVTCKCWQKAQVIWRKCCLPGLCWYHVLQGHCLFGLLAKPPYQQHLVWKII